MKSNVTYEKSMRERAIKEGKGLFTLQIIEPGKKQGKLGGRIEMQGPANTEDYKSISAFMLSLMKARAARK